MLPDGRLLGVAPGNAATAELAGFLREVALLRPNQVPTIAKPMDNNLKIGVQ